MFMAAFEVGFAIFLGSAWVGGLIYEKMHKED